MKRRKPAEVFHPSELVAEELEARGQTLEKLRCKNWGDEEIDAFMVADLPMDTWLAMHLARLWKISPELWINLQAPWDDWPDRRSQPPDIPATIVPEGRRLSPLSLERGRSRDTR